MIRAGPSINAVKRGQEESDLERIQDLFPNDCLRLYDRDVVTMKMKGLIRKRSTTAARLQRALSAKALRPGTGDCSGDPASPQSPNRDQGLPRTGQDKRQFLMEAPVQFTTMRPEDVARAVALYNDGRSVRYIANVMNIARSTTHDAIKRYRETLEYTRRPGSGRSRATNTNEDRYMVLRVLRERNLPATSVAQQFVNMHGRPISAKTVRRRLKASGLISNRPATGPRLLRMHRVERLRFANDHRDWRNGQWSCVLFTDEFRFNLYSPDGRQRVWRRRGERFSQCCILKMCRMEVVE
ncbi:hypothetical protein ANN_15099 [Periplaneta americana]|uniref:Transposase Tc1-like domain-containing protein n=1 Tax=Periplaneta americana TaxID=6978 RepID=A0ABQ8SZR6_PERAM|nr:hypothetical protein ANN_15099 [Periplaneta americana]